MIKNIIFDFDGTLGDSLDIACKIGTEVANTKNMSMTVEEFKFIFRHKGMKDLIKKLKLTKKDVMYFTYQFMKKQKKHIHEIELFEDIPDVLRRLDKEGYNLGIVTSNDENPVKNILRRNNLMNFDFVKKTSLFGKDKTLLKMMKKHGYKLEETVYIGDEKRDIRACKKIGLKEIAVSYGFSSKMLLEQESPQIIIDSPSEILKIVQNYPTRE